MPYFIYSTTVPNPPNLPRQDVGAMQTNSASINSIINVDHFTFQSNGNQDGYHKQVSLVNEAAPGVPANANGVMFANAAGGNSWPFWQNALGSFQLTGSTSANIPLAATNGYSFLPGGMIIQWGNFANTTTGIKAIPFNINFPTNLFYATAIAQSTSNNGAAPITVITSSTANLNVLVGGITNAIQGILWMAIGN